MKSLLVLFIIFVSLLSFPKVNFGQAPDLGAASTFTLFTADGAFNNYGESYITGDIGTNAGEFTGNPTVDGEIHIVDAVSAQAAIDVNIAYNQLIANTCGTVLGTPFGNGQTLTPNVYCAGGASNLNGNLTLDGQGNPDALFIFKIDGELSTSKYSNVILINSALLSNVYWQINGAFNLGDSSVFKGTIIANGAINLLEGSTLEGKGLSIVGAINIFSITANFTSSTLPIELLYFNVSTKHTYNILSWSTATETNNNYFTLERAIDGINFTEISRINGAGNSSLVLLYSAIDNNPINGSSYYRLKQTDFNGKFSYSNIVAVKFEKQFDFNIYPNPFNKSITITINDATQTDNAELRIFNVMGEEVIKSTITKQSTNLETGNLDTGIYFYKVIDNNKVIQSGKLISKK